MKIKRMGAVKTVKKKFSFLNKKGKQRVRVVEGNKEQNGINITVGSLNESASTLRPGGTQGNSLNTQLPGHLGMEEACRDGFPLRITALPQDKIVLNNIFPSGSQAAKRWET